MLNNSTELTLETAENNTSVFETNVTVLNDFGLHARPAANLARVAQDFKSDIKIYAGEQMADAKSILDILSLAASRNTELTIQCRGEDAREAGETLARMFEAKFHLEN